MLQWLHYLEKQPVFVANRVAEILEQTTADEWYHVQSADNPADAGTRGLSAKALWQSSWLTGPKFLKTNERPFTPSGDFRLKLKQAKLDPTDEPSTELCTMLSETQSATANTFEWQKYGSYETLLRIVVYVLRLLSKNRDYRTNSGVIIDPAELENSEHRFLYLTQAESFQAEKSNQLNQSRSVKHRKSSDSPPLLNQTVSCERLAEQNYSKLPHLMSNTPFYWMPAIH